MPETHTLSSYLENFRGEALPYRQVLEHVNSLIPFTQAVMLSTLPRGGLQIIQPPRLPDQILRSYARRLHAYDRLSWQAIASGRAVRARDVWPAEEFDSAAYAKDLMAANGFAFAAAAPLACPVIEGYPGALHLYRTISQGAFSDEELQILSRIAHEIDAAIARVRTARSDAAYTHEPMSHFPPVKQFILDSHLHSAIPQADPSALDERLRQNLLDDARRRFEHVNGRQVVADRVPLPDSRGDLWNFRVVIHRSYPALNEGPVVFFCLQPTWNDWSALRSSDFQADNELARLIPALKFMREQFHRGPTLVEIARTVHLSPFHFHRRFTELLGITPKHVLLDCQIHQAKKDLVEGTLQLAEIAAKCGFAHQSHFTSRFKQAAGMTPTRWRRMAINAKL